MFKHNLNFQNLTSFFFFHFKISSAPEQSDVISLHIRVVGHWTNKLYEYFEAEQKRLQCKLKGGNCAEPESRYESFHRTMMAARDRARRTSISILGSENRKASTRSVGQGRRDSTMENNNLGYISYGDSREVLEHSVMSDTEKKLRLRMAKRDALMR